MCFRTSGTLKKYITTNFFFLLRRCLSVRHTFVVEWVKKKKLMCLKCGLGPQEPLKQISQLFFLYSVGYTFVCRSHFCFGVGGWFPQFFLFNSLCSYQLSFFRFLPRDFKKLTKSGMFLTPSKFLIASGQFM